MTFVPLTFVIASNDRGILNSNLLASPCLRDPTQHQVIVQEGYYSAASAYNEALKHAVNDVVVFVHQDVFLPADWISDLTRALGALELSDPNWGVLGCCGITPNGTRIGHLYTPGEGVIGAPLRTPQPVRVLDEVVLVLRKSSELMFSDDLPGFHFYGPDVCLTAARQGMNNYAISAFCIHNSCQYFEFPVEFYVCYGHMKRKWSSSIPIQTSCICISRFDADVWKHRIKRLISFVRGRHFDRGPRISDPRVLWKQIQTEGH